VNNQGKVRKKKKRGKQRGLRSVFLAEKQKGFAKCFLKGKSDKPTASIHSIRMLGEVRSSRQKKQGGERKEISKVARKRMEKTIKGEEEVHLGESRALQPARTTASRKKEKRPDTSPFVFT